MIEGEGDAEKDADYRSRLDHYHDRKPIRVAGNANL